MRPVVRIVSLLVALLVPVLASALSDASYTGITPGISSYSSQVFSSGNLFAPLMGFGLGGGIYGIATNIIYIINGVLVPVLFAVSFIVFLYGIAKTYIFSTGNEEAIKEGHKIILWGLIAFAVMISLWGLVNVVVNTFGLQSQFAPHLPLSPSFIGPPLPPP